MSLSLKIAQEHPWTGITGQPFIVNTEHDGGQLYKFNINELVEDVAAELGESPDMDADMVMEYLGTYTKYVAVPNPTLPDVWTQDEVNQLGLLLLAKRYEKVAEHLKWYVENGYHIYPKVQRVYDAIT